MLPGVAKRRLGSVAGKERLAQRMPRQEAGTLIAGRDTCGELIAQHGHGIGRQIGIELVLRQQLDAAIQILGQDLKTEIRACLLARADGIQRLLERQAVETVAAEHEHAIEQVADAVLAVRLLDAGLTADMAVDADGVADILRSAR